MTTQFQPQTESLKALSQFLDSKGFQYCPTWDELTEKTFYGWELKLPNGGEVWVTLLLNPERASVVPVVPASAIWDDTSLIGEFREGTKNFHELHLVQSLVEQRIARVNEF